MREKSLLLFVFLFFFTFTCREKAVQVTEKDEKIIPTPPEEEKKDIATAISADDIQEHVSTFMEPEKKAAMIVADMEDNALTGQVIIAGLDGQENLGWTMRRLLMENPPGAIMLFSYNLNTDKETARSLLAECVRIIADVSLVPFMAVDHEGGDVHRFGFPMRKLPSAASVRFRVLAVGQERALEELEYQAFLSGTEIRSVGITMNFAPVAEILTPENAAFLQNRSFGPDGDFVEDASAAFIYGMRRAGVACVVKHFPGNAAVDPHKAKPVLDADAQTVGILVKPFGGLVRKVNPSAIMLSHVVVSTWDKERNASLSPIAVQRLRELGFEGIVIADDFSMSAVSNISAENAAVQALNVGVDMVMAWPRNLATTRRSLENALKNNVIKRERLVEAAVRIVAQKIRSGILEVDL
ncbi:MAG: glycoside hydrolase family 3 protein [Treponema sp.]|jgi:beta-N-acetylhexosaminidase|nr:glycoside hydrolase family 3 protein [Treponema sp.]